MKRLDSIIDYSGQSKDFNGIYTLPKVFLDEIAEKIISAIDKSHLLTPRQIPILEWLDDGVFGNKLDYKDMIVPKAYGLTSFHNKIIITRDSDSKKLALVRVEAKTIILNDTLPETQLRFTAGHETIHFLLHPYYYESKPTAIAANYNCGNAISFSPESFWLEWQANYGSGSLLMPRNPLKIIANDFVEKGEILNEHHQKFWPLIKEVSKVFNVSKFAAGVRLRQNGYITDYPDNYEKILSNATNT